MKIHFVIYEENDVLGTGIIDCGNVRKDHINWQEETSGLALDIRDLRDMSKKLIADNAEITNDIKKLKHDKFEEYLDDQEGKKKNTKK